MIRLCKSIGFVLILLALSLFVGTNSVSAQASISVLYVPLIGITSVPTPLASPVGPGNVTYNYAVKNFLREVPLANIQVADNHCSPVRFVEGDDNRDSRLDYDETWRYACTTNVSVTTQSIATATGMANDNTAMHKAYATVVVGSGTTPPLVSIVNVTKVANPFPIPAEGGKLIFTYKVNNPGAVALSDVTVTDDKCGTIPGKLGDTNGNQFLDINEVWVYTCSAILSQTTTNTAIVSAFANGLQAKDDTTLTVNVVASDQSPANLFDVAISPVAVGNPDLKIPVWIALSVILLLLVIFYLLTGKSKPLPARPSRFETGNSKKK